MTKTEVLIENISDGLVDILLNKIYENAEAYGRTELGLTERKDIIQLYVLITIRTIEKMKDQYKVGIHKSIFEELGL